MEDSEVRAKEDGQRRVARIGEKACAMVKAFATELASALRSAMLMAKALAFGSATRMVEALASESAMLLARAMALGSLMAVAVLLAGCVSVRATTLGAGAVREPVAADAVVVYRKADQVEGRYEEVALLDAVGESITTGDARMYEEMRKKAGALGANGIVLDSFSEPALASRVARVLLGTPALRRGKAVAIVVDR